MKRKCPPRKVEIKQEVEEQHGDTSQSDDDDESKQRGRLDNSLSVLTKKFVSLIKKQPQNTIDLNEAVQELNVQKRRIYDITNVLQGIGYVEKLQKNTIKWMGESDELDNQKQIKNYLNQMQQLQDEQRELHDQLDKLNRDIKKNYLENQQTRMHQYITTDDCKHLTSAYSFFQGKSGNTSKGNSLVILSAPHGSTLEAYDQPSGNSKLVMNSTGKGEIRVFVSDEKGTVSEYKDQ